MRFAGILVILTIFINIISANEEFEMDMRKVQRTRLDVDEHKGGFT